MHRFGLNFNETIATELAGFFFPTSDLEIVRKREEDWAKFGDGRQDPDFDPEPPEKSDHQHTALSLRTHPCLLSVRRW